MSDVEREMNRPYDVLSIEFDPVERAITVTILDPIRSSRAYGIMPEVRQLRLDGTKWEHHIEAILDDVADLIQDYEQAGKPMTRPGRGTDDPGD